MEYQNIKVVVDERIAVVTINRPRSLNSLNTETIRELGAVFDELTADENVLGVILTGAGDRSFIAGADINELSQKDPESARAFALLGQAVCDKIENCPKPVIAAVNGFALGGGCEVAMACHMRVAAAHARFGQPEVGLGVIPGFGGTQRLPRLVGKGRALELALGGGMIDAGEAFRIGLANCVLDTVKTDADNVPLTDEKGRNIFDADEFIAQVKGMMKGFIAKSPRALGYVIEAVNRGLEVPLSEGLRIEADLFGLIYNTDDAREGLEAYLKKRTPEFKGK